jgi:hypothetical protein
MPRLTPTGKIYTTDELINLAKIGQMGNMSEACLYAFFYIKELEARVKELENRSPIPPGFGDVNTAPVSTEVKDK